jgi:hypothetical protein
MLQRDFIFKNFEKFDYRLFLGVLITVLGFILRYYQYDSLPPYNWTQDEFAFANSYSADSDIAFRMYADADMLFRQEVGMQIAKGRRIDATRIIVFLSNLTKMEFDFFEESEVIDELNTTPIEYD